MKYPAEVDLGFFNADFATPQRIDQRVIAFFLTLKIQILAAVEMKVDNMHQMLDPHSWNVAQVVGKRNRAKQGSAIAWLKTLSVIVRPPRIGVRHGAAKMMNRWQRIIDVHLAGGLVRIIVAHNPPRRYAWLWKAWYAAVRFRASLSPNKGAWVVVADFNENHRFARRKLRGAGSDGREVIGIVWGPKVHVREVQFHNEPKDRRWIDHPCFVARGIKVKAA